MRYLKNVGKDYQSTRNNIPEDFNPQYHRREEREIIHQSSYNMTLHNHIPNATNAINRVHLVHFFITYPSFMHFGICYLYYLKNIILVFKQGGRWLSRTDRVLLALVIGGLPQYSSNITRTGYLEQILLPPADLQPLWQIFRYKTRVFNSSCLKNVQSVFTFLLFN